MTGIDLRTARPTSLKPSRYIEVSYMILHSVLACVAMWNFDEGLSNDVVLLDVETLGSRVSLSVVTLQLAPAGAVVAANSAAISAVLDHVLLLAVTLIPQNTTQ